MPNPDLTAIQRISASAFGRYQTGFSITDGIDAACCGHDLDEFSRMLVESRVVALVCAEDPKFNGKIATLPWRIAERRDDATLDLGSIVARARTAELHAEEAAMLSICAHWDQAWDAIVEIVTLGTLWKILPEHVDGQAERQNRLAKQIANAALEDRIAALCSLRAGTCDGIGFDAVVAATLCKPIYEALAQVRVGVTLTR